MTYTIIGGDKNEYGPITDSDMRQWIAEGRLNAQSLAKNETDIAWRTLGSFPEFKDVLAVKSSASPAPAAEDPNWLANVTSRTPELRFGECMGAGWNFLAANAGFVIGAVFLAWLLNFVLVLFSMYVPLIGALAAMCFIGVIFGGLYLACIRRMRGETVSPVEALAGFKIAFGQLVLAGLISILLTEISFCFLILPAIYLGIAWTFSLPLVADKRLFFWSAMELSRKVVTRVWFEVFAMVLLAYIPMLCFQIYNLYHGIGYFVDLFHQSNNDWQQFAKNIPGHMDEVRAMSLKMTFIGQAILLVNLFYFVGVLARAYENLFSPRKG